MFKSLLSSLSNRLERLLSAKPQDYTRQEVADAIEDFLNGMGRDYDWDDFCTFPIVDPELDQIRERCAQLDAEFPPEHPGEYCSSAGANVLRDYVVFLRQEGD